MIYGPRGSGGLYSKKFHNERKVSGENGPETDSEAPTPCLGAARGGPAPRHGVEPPGSVSTSFPALNFPYFLKIVKI